MRTDIPPEKAAVRRAAEVLGGQPAMALLLGYSDRRNVSPWFTTDRPFPAEYCPLVEQETRRLGKPVLCEELRPDVAWAVLRASGADLAAVAAKAMDAPEALGG